MNTLSSPPPPQTIILLPVILIILLLIMFLDKASLSEGKAKWGNFEAPAWWNVQEEGEYVSF